MKEIAWTLTEREGRSPKAQPKHSKRSEGPIIKRIKSQIRLEVLALCWLIVGMIIISIFNRHVIAKFFFPDMPKFLRRSIPIHLLYYWVKPHVEKWFGIKRETVEELH